MKTHDYVEELNRLLKAQLQEWQLREQHKDHCPKPVVTITREPGSGGEAIAQKLAAELGLHLYDWELVEKIAADLAASPRLVSALEKHPTSEFDEWWADLGQADYILSQSYCESLKRVLSAIVVAGNAVIVGRGSNFLVPPDRRIGLCFIAPLALRVKSLMQEQGLTEEAARHHISHTEAEHRKLLKKYLQTDIREPDHYHLVINTALVKPDTVVQLVKAMLRAFQAEKEKSHDR